jgi:hypothetical protein
MILKSAYGYRVRWREHGALRQQTCSSYDAARRLDARKVLKKRGGQRRRQVVDPINPKISVKDFAQHWLERTRFRVAPKTHASYAETVERYIVKQGVGIGGLRVNDVRRDDIETMLEQASVKSRSGALSKNTLRIIRATCSLLFDAAMNGPDPLIEANPCQGIKLGTLTKADRQRIIRAMDYTQIVRFLRAAKRTALNVTTPCSILLLMPTCARVKHWRCSGRTLTSANGRSPSSAPSLSEARSSDRLTAARQAKGDLNGDFVRPGRSRKHANASKLLAPRAGLEPATS